MELGFVGLGRMGKAMVLRLLKKGVRVVVYNRSPEPREYVVSEGAIPASSLEELVNTLTPPRMIWIMVTAGDPVEQVIFSDKGIANYLDKKDLVIEGGNSHYEDSQRRAESLKEMGIDFLDVGVSGGLGGAAKGLSLSIGGERQVFEKSKPIFKILAAPEGFAHLGPSGAGHFVKMVHNGIEYALLQVLGEGLELLNSGPFKFDNELVTRTWNKGGVIRSWLLELLEKVFQNDPKLKSIAGRVGGGETGRWALEEGLKRGVPLPLISLALEMRFRSRQEESFASKVVAALRKEFGGHKPPTRQKAGKSQFPNPKSHPP